MKNNSISADRIEYIVSRLLAGANGANDALSEYSKNPKDGYNIGRKEAYYEMLDTLKSELSVDYADLKKLGLDIDLERKYI